jgi:hypothetical protein
VAENNHKTGDLYEAIRARAYELYLARGCEDGFAQDDWLRAEAEITTQYERRSA